VSATRVLLLGGTGFMGGPTARALLERGHEVTVLSRGRRPIPEGAARIVADRRDPAAVAAALEGHRFDFTVDFTAYDAPDIQRLLLVPYAALGRFVMISTGQVYLVAEGTKPPYREEDSDRPVIPEPPADSPDHAGWSYGVGKRRAEGALLGLRSTHGVRAVVLRLPIVQGEGDGSLRLWAYLERLLDGGPLVLPDGGTQPVRHLWSGDVTRAVIALLEGPRPPESVYNLSQPEIVTLRELLERVARAAGVQPRFVDAPWSAIDEAGIDRAFSPYAGPWCSVLDPSRAGGSWGFLGTRLDEYLPRVVRWHLEHRPSESHPGYAWRAQEVALAERLALAR
jgi:nucleoside-diphosphate-sugar epimerase